MKKILLLISACIAWSVALHAAVPRVQIDPPDLNKIKSETTNPNSKYYYPKLLKSFMNNDTIMQNEDFRYFYYGALYQEDYDPYRGAMDEERLAKIQPLYYKSEHSDSEKKAILKYAEDALRDNPIDLVQLKNKVYVLEHEKKVNLAKIWKNKLNHLLYVIVSSGSGISKDSPWIVVYPRHEFDLFNMYGLSVQNQEYELPHHDHVTLEGKSGESQEYFFDLGPVLEQYYLKHPSEYSDDSGEE